MFSADGLLPKPCIFDEGGEKFTVTPVDRKCRTVQRGRNIFMSDLGSVPVRISATGALPPFRLNRLNDVSTP
jgi:hypothetical protein